VSKTWKKRYHAPLREEILKNLTTNHTNGTTNGTTNYADRKEPHEQESILYKDECYKIYGCIYAVNNKLGSGFLEAVYQEALEIELRRENIPFLSQQKLEILYDGIPLTSKYIADIVCYDKIIIEIKAISKINSQHKAQLLNYLTATGYRLGLLVNFNSYPKAEVIRMVR